MMEQKRWRVLFWVAFVLLVFCAPRAVRRPAASDGAQRLEACEGRVPSDDNEMDARFEAMESMDANITKAADAAQLKQREAAKEMQL